MVIKSHPFPYFPNTMSPSIVPSTMTAAVYVPGNNKLVITKDYPTPKPAADEVLLKIKACGVCHSDVCLYFGALRALVPDGSYRYSI